MMNNIKDMTVTICFSMIALGYLSILAPTHRLNKIFKLFMNLFFLTVLLTPIFTFSGYNSTELGDKVVIGEESSATDINRLVEESLNQQIKLTLESQIRLALQKENLFVKKLELDFQVSEDKKIEVVQIKAFIENSGEKEKIHGVISQLIDCPILIVFE